MKLNPVLLLLHALCAMLLLVACGGGGEGSKPPNQLDEYTKLVAPIDGELDKLYERMNDGFDDAFSGLLTASNSSSQAMQASELTAYSQEMYKEWDTLLQRFVQITPPSELMGFHELYQHGLQLYHRAFFDFSTSLTILANTGQIDNEMITEISNDMMEADRKFTQAGAEWAKVQDRYR